MDGARTVEDDAPGLNSAARWPDRVVVINDISAPRGGASSIALTGARAVHARGIPVNFITGDDAADIAVKDRAITFTPVDSAHILDGPRLKAAVRGVYNSRASKFLQDWIARHDTPQTVYHLHGWSKALSPSVLQALRSVAGRIVIHAHDYFLACPNGGYFDYQRETACERRPLSLACLTCNCDRRGYSHKIWRSIRQAVLSSIFNSGPIGLVVPVHEGMLPLLERGGIARQRMRVLRNPVTAWQTECVSAERNSTFLYVGRIDEDKGVHLLAEAARVARVPLRLIGTGPLASILEEKYPEFEFCGWKHQSEIKELCCDVRAMVMPSQCRETFGLSIFEALLSGIPTIVSHHVMAAGEIVKGGLGLSCNPASTSEFADILSQIAQNHDLTRSMSHKAYVEGPRLVPSLEQWSDELIEIYVSLLALADNSNRKGQKS